MSNKTTEAAPHEESSFADEIGIIETTINHAGDAVQLCLHANIPALLIGASSTAKTAKMREIAAYNGARLVIYSLASKEAQDLTGPQFPRRDGTFTYLRDGQVPVMYDPVEDDRILLERVLYANQVDLLDFREGHASWSQTFAEAVALLEGGEQDAPLKERLVDALIRARSGERAQDEPVLLFIDEVNRGSKDTLNAAMPLWAERKLGTKTLGPNVRVVAAMNPPHGSYAVNAVFSEDSAMRRRLVQIGVKFSDSDFAAYRRDPLSAVHSPIIPPVNWSAETRKTRKFHPTANKFLNANPAYQYDQQAYLAGKVYGCPATWEAASWLMFSFDENECKVDNYQFKSALQAVLAGCVGIYCANELVNSYHKEINYIDPMDLLLNFDSKSNKAFVDSVCELVEEGHALVVTDALASAAAILRDTPTEDWDMPQLVNSVAHLFRRLPMRDTRVFLNAAYENAVGEVSSRLSALFVKLPAHEDYKEYVKGVRRASTAQTEAMRASRDAS